MLPGGFSYGDYLRSGAMAAHSPIMREVIKRAKAGTPVLGICNGFQVLTEARLLPGVLMRNADAEIHLQGRASPRRADRHELHRAAIKRAKSCDSPSRIRTAAISPTTRRLTRLEGEGRVAFRYCDTQGQVTAEANPNGSRRNIAGIYNETGTVLGLMPHPERLADPALSGTTARRCSKVWWKASLLEPRGTLGWAAAISSISVPPQPTDSHLPHE